MHHLYASHLISKSRCKRQGAIRQQKYMLSVKTVIGLKGLVYNQIQSIECCFFALLFVVTKVGEAYLKQNIR